MCGSSGPEGKVYAIDTNLKFLEFVSEGARKKGLDNVETILATGDRLNLPEKSIDLVFMRNVTHHIPNRVEYFRNLRNAMKPAGRIAIIEYKQGGRFSFRGFFGHYIKKEIIVEEMAEAGYQLVEDFDFLPEQSFTIYRKK
ncbi:MAG: class I SAM-dependent methyltransferase [Candidatus Hodarchaeaceae archaeon]|nr:class I SAM-dependent methyltransferase [Candidatus Hodarchaeaceae archaeon]